MADAILAVIFVGSAGYAVLMVWRKIPLLLQVPQQLIEESFVTRPPRLKKYLEPAWHFFRHKHYLDLYYAVLVGILHSVRLWLLRLERIVFRMLEALQARGRRLSETEERYWSELKQWKEEARQNGNHIPHEIINEAAPPELTSKNSSRNKTPA